MRIIVAVTGASGVVIGVRLIEELVKGGHEAHVIVSDGARNVAKYEGVSSLKDIEKIASNVYDENDLAASIASSSNIIDAMIVVPCSMKTLSAIANGYSDNLIVRAAENALKMNWQLIVVPRDTPLSLAAIENMRKIKLAGGIILPPAVAYYPKPKKIDDVTDFFVGKILDTLKIEHNLYRKWK